MCTSRSVVTIRYVCRHCRLAVLLWCRLATPWLTVSRGTMRRISWLRARAIIFFSCSMVLLVRLHEYSPLSNVVSIVINCYLVTVIINCYRSLPRVGHYPFGELQKSWKQKHSNSCYEVNIFEIWTWNKTFRFSFRLAYERRQPSSRHGQNIDAKRENGPFFSLGIASDVFTTHHHIM